MTQYLENKVVIVTGSGHGVGRAHALAFASQGAKVVVNDIGVNKEGDGGSGAPADETVAMIKENGGEAVANYDSVADFKAASRIIEQAVDTYGRLDVLVNNAGIFRRMLFHQMTEEDFDSVIDVHLKGTFNTCRHAAPVMMKQKHGRIINTASSQWRNPEGYANYAAAKGGIVSLTYDLAWELRTHGITVNAIAPQAQTGQDSARHHEEMIAAGLMPPERAALIQSRPGPEFNPPMVMFLASDMASHINGCVFRVGANKVAIYTHPTEERGIYKNIEKDGPWTLEELEKLLPGTVLAGPTKAPHIPS
jgi:NAD(P)-dependent dehydrogenase (short-subunit alcohol dehydrogenase family)